MEHPFGKIKESNGVTRPNHKRTPPETQPGSKCSKEIRQHTWCWAREMVCVKTVPTARAHNMALETHKITLETHKITLFNDNIFPHSSNITITPHRYTNLRPGRRHNRISASIVIHSTHGDSHLVRDKNDIRIIFQNVKGLTYSHIGEDFGYYTASKKGKKPPQHLSPWGRDTLELSSKTVSSSTAWQRLCKSECRVA